MKEGHVMHIKLLKANQEGSNLPTVDPKSLALFGYAKLIEYHYGLEVKLEESTDGDLNRIPHVLFEDKIISEIEDLRRTPAIVEKLRGIPPHSIMTEVESFITDVEKACVRGLKLLQPGEQLWQSKDTEEESDILTGRVKISFQSLSDMLGDNAYLLDMYYGKQEACASYLDAKLFGAGIVIYKCFGSSNQADRYCSRLHDVLKSHLNLDAYFDRMDAQLILSLSFNPRTYKREVAEDPDFLDKCLENAESIASGNSLIFEYTCGAVNLLGLPAGNCALKVTQLSPNSRFEREIHMYYHLLHISFIRLIGYGSTFRPGTDSSNDWGFMVLPLMKNGNLENKIKELDWPTAIKLAREIAYSIHIAHTSCFILSDLKPRNILIDDNGSAIMCDFDEVQDPLVGVGPGCQNYRDLSATDADRFIDIYSYGVILLQMLSGVRKIYHGFEATMRRKTEDGENIISERLKNTGCNEQISAKMIELALDCTKKERETRPSALTIVKRLDAVVAHEEAIAVLRDEEEMTSMSEATFSYGTRRHIFSVGGITVLVLLATVYTLRKYKKG